MNACLFDLANRFDKPTVLKIMVRSNSVHLLWLSVLRPKVLTHLKPPRRFFMPFFDVLPFTDDASVVNGKTSKKSMQKRRGGFFFMCQDPYLLLMSVSLLSSPYKVWLGRLGMSYPLD